MVLNDDLSIFIWPYTHSFVLLDVHSTLTSLFHTLSSKASIFFISAFLITHVSLPYVTTGNTNALIILILVFSVMFLSFIIDVKLVIAFLPSISLLLIFFVWSEVLVNVQPRTLNSCTTSMDSPSTSKLVISAVVITFVFFKFSSSPFTLLAFLTFLISYSRSSLVSAIRVVSSAYLKLLMILPFTFILMLFLI